MNMLALDTSSKTVGIALLQDRDVLVETFFNLGINASLLLMPAIEKVLRDAELSVERIDLWACTLGPGSFTGLRIGIGTVKGLAVATGRPVVGVSTLEALAFNGIQADLLLCPMMDAQRDQVYTALYRPEPGFCLQRVGEERLVELAAFLPTIDERALFLGDGAIKYRQRIQEMLPGRSLFAAPHLHAVRASAVGLLGMDQYERGEVLDLLTFAPQYLRLSEAEVKLRQQQAKRVPAGEDK